MRRRELMLLGGAMTAASAAEGDAGLNWAVHKPATPIRGHVNTFPSCRKAAD
jgi:hypothetical protein